MRYLFLVTFVLGVLSGCSVLDTHDDIDLSTLPPTASGPDKANKGTIVQEFWDGIEGTTVRDLTRSNKFTKESDSSLILTGFKGATNKATHYGSRIRGYLYPEVTGPYTFYISSNDSSELWLSTGESPNNKRLIAYMDGWASVGDTQKYATQKSASISLEANKIYYIEALQKQGSGSDQLAVYWEGPGIATEVIPGNHLSPVNMLSENTGAGYATGYRLGYYDGTFKQAYNDVFPPSDSDGDGLPDSYELALGLDPLDKTDATADSDGDLLNNLDEFLLRTDPFNKDTDGDGIDDGYEVAYGLNALNASDATLDLDQDGTSNFDEYLAGTDANDSESFPAPPAPPEPSEPGKTLVPGWSTQFYGTSVLIDPILFRNDASINFGWGRDAPAPNVPADNFSVRFTGFFVPDQQGTHTFLARANDYVKLWVGNQLVIDHWSTGGTTVHTGSINLEKGKEYPIKLEYAEGVGNAVIKLRWNTDGNTDVFNDSKLLNDANIKTIDTANDTTTDSDKDQIPDYWELTTGTDPFDPTDATGDIDRDGIDNLTAYLNSIKTVEPLAGFTAQYFSGIEMDKIVLVKQEPAIDFDWGRGSPYSEVPSDNFSVRFLSRLTPAHNSGTEDYTFYVTANDYARLYIDGHVVVDHWTTGSTDTYTGQISLTAGETYDLILEYAEGAGSAFIKLEWASASQSRAVVSNQYTAFSDREADLVSDSDNDGMPDYWEIQYGLNPLNSNDATLDNDGDGVANNQEFINNSDPGSTGLVAPPTGSGVVVTPPIVEEPPVQEPAPETPPQTGDEGVIITTGTVTLNWTAPTKRVDGTNLPLSEIRSYIVGYTKDSGSAVEAAPIPPHQLTHTYESLLPGVYDFYIKVTDTDGLTGPASTPVRATLK
ncbi:PA14 domain-containing protein [Alkalimarinus alittae]|uniref:PA14 domain-containing protein n=1 Tax=Alkalimarinus alittae TaxID=2961619 RepID=A0ABY6MX02_9ALTE|nr:PA14 domain-containing protein [Alkalimarinus alittae]UZE94371.1 PA14 domain-containing protein [Alkalimarinus alittae]